MHAAADATKTAARIIRRGLCSEITHRLS
jgi:hypothetical protein